MRILQNLFLITVLSMMTTSFLIGQVGTLGSILNDGEGGGDGIAEVIFHDCTPTIPLTVSLANLDGVSGNYYIPADRPDMYLEYYTNNTPVTRVHLTSFEEFNSNTNRFVTAVNTQIDISDQCPSEDLIYVHLWAKLVTPNLRGAGYVDYPACEYTGIDDIFSCEVFYYAGLCRDEPIPDDSDPQVCDNDKLIKGGFKIKGYCPTVCEDTPDNPRGNEGYQVSATRGNISVYPNPVSSTLNVQWPADKLVEEIVLYRLDGSRIKTWSKNQLEGRTMLEASTDFLNQGIYLLEVRFSDTSQIIKVVK